MATFLKNTWDQKTTVSKYGQYNLPHSEHVYTLQCSKCITNSNSFNELVVDFLLQKADGLSLCAWSPLLQHLVAQLPNAQAWPETFCLLCSGMPDILGKKYPLGVAIN